MKKLISVTLTALMLTSLFAVITFAGDFNARDHWNLDEVGQIIVKKANPDDVVKDGIIGENEYVRYSPDLGTDTSYLFRTYVGGQAFEDSEAMLPTMEYYFSWDEVHGINIAIRNTHRQLYQTIPQGEGDKPGDDFAWDAAYVINAETLHGRNGDGDEHNFCLYYALGKRTDTGEYLEGHYQQFGNTGYYNPTPDVDYIITYSGNTSLIEWSIPFENLIPDAKAGTVLKFTLTATGGTTDDPEDRDSSYGIALGDIGYAVSNKHHINHAEYLLSDDPVAETPGPGPDPTTAPEPTVGPDPTVGPEPTAGPDESTVPPQTDESGNPVTEPPQTDESGNPIETEVPTDESGNPIETEVPTDESGNPVPAPISGNGGNGGNGGETAPRTGDPMMIVAAISALGACGAFVIKKRFF